MFGYVTNIYPFLVLLLPNKLFEPCACVLPNRLFDVFVLPKLVPVPAVPNVFACALLPNSPPPPVCDVFVLLPNRLVLLVVFCVAELFPKSVFPPPNEVLVEVFPNIPPVVPVVLPVFPNRLFDPAVGP